MRISLILFLSGLLIATGLSADIYKTVDKNGNVIYSDSPPNDQAEVVKLRELNTLPPQGESGLSQTYAPPEAAVAYQVRIVSPRNEVVIPPGQRDLAVAIILSPSLEQDHLIVYYIDGELIEETQATNIVIQDPPRGGRTLTVEVIDQSGEVLGRSEALTINVIRPVIRK